MRGAQEPSQRRDLKYIHIHIYTIIYSPEMACRDGVPQRTSSLIPIDAKVAHLLKQRSEFCAELDRSSRGRPPPCRRRGSQRTSAATHTRSYGSSSSYAYHYHSHLLTSRHEALRSPWQHPLCFLRGSEHRITNFSRGKGSTFFCWINLTCSC